MKKHVIIKNGSPELIQYEHLAKYEDKIPIEIAIIHSGFSPESWEKLNIKKKVITRKEKNDFEKQISTNQIEEMKQFNM